ncbi:MAG: RNA-binding protein [Phycisphaerales bacterium]
MMFKIYVGNLSFDAAESEVEQLFGQHGEVQSVTIVTDRDTGRSRGFGFVEMTDDAQGQAAIDAINGSELGGRTLKVNKARPRERDQRGGGGGQRDRW